MRACENCGAFGRNLQLVERLDKNNERQRGCTRCCEPRRPAGPLRACVEAYYEFEHDLYVYCLLSCGHVYICGYAGLSPDDFEKVSSACISRRQRCMPCWKKPHEGL